MSKYDLENYKKCIDRVKAMENIRKPGVITWDDIKKFETIKGGNPILNFYMLNSAGFMPTKII